MHFLARDLLCTGDAGLVRYRDENESEYIAGFFPTEKRFYPYQDSVSILDEWFTAHPDERALRQKLTISGLSSAIKAEASWW